MGRDAQGFRFDFAKECAKLGTPVNCNITFYNNGTVKTLGPYQPGNFTGRPDLAGPGVLLAFAVPYLLQFFALIPIVIAMSQVPYRKVKFRRFLCNVFMVSPSVSHPTGWRKKLAKAYRNILLAASDSQSLLSMAYWVNFYIKGKCELSAYHYRLAIDIGLISCSSFISSTLMIRNYYKKPITAILRYMIISTVFGLLGILIFYQRDGLSGPEQWPKNRKTSAILLPASCFLDPDFHVFQGNTSQKIRDQIGNPDNTVRFPMIFWIMDLILLIFSCIKNLYQSYFDKVHPEAADYPYIWRCLTRFYKVLAFLILFATSSIAWTHILWLLVFVNDSGWIKLNSSKTNPERTFSDIGQLISLFSMFSILISFSQLYKWLPEQDSTADEELQNYGRGQWQEVSSYNDSEILARSDDNSQPPSMEGFANISVDAIRATHPRTHIPPKPRWEGTVT